MNNSADCLNVQVWPRGPLLKDVILTYQKIVLLYVALTIALIGILTGVFSFYLFTRDNLIPRTTRQLLLAMTSVDILFLLNSFIYLLPVKSIRNCKEFFFLIIITVNIFEMLRNWIVVLVCFERFIITCFPLRAKKWLRLSRTNAFIGACVILSFLTRIQIMVSGAIQLFDSTRKEALKMLTLIHAVIDATFLNLIPLSIIIFCSLKIYFCIRKSDIYREKVSNVSLPKSPQIQRKYRSKSVKVTRVLLVVIGVFAILMLPTIPLSISALTMSLIQFNCPLYISDRFLAPLASLGSILHSLTNFIIYVLCWKKYRVIFLHIIRCKHAPEITVPSRSTSYSNVSMANSRTLKLHIYHS